MNLLIFIASTYEQQRSTDAGYTLVARIDDVEFDPIKDILEKEEANKIPYGRNCDREAANVNLPYHITLFHWAKEQDEQYLQLINRLVFYPFSVNITDISIMYGEEGSSILYLPVNPTIDYETFSSELKSLTGMNLPSFLHITLAVSKDCSQLAHLKRIICEYVAFPISITVKQIELYHIWQPVYLARTWT